MSTCRTVAGLLLAITLGCGGNDHTGPSVQPPPPGLTGRIAYVHTELVTGYFEYTLHVLDLATGKDRLIYPAPARAQIWGVTWAPGGAQLVVQTAYLVPGADAEYYLHRIFADGSSDAIVFDGAGPELDPAYSPAGQLAYIGGFSDMPAFGIWIDGKPFFHCFCDSGPAWSADGKSFTVVTWDTTGLGGAYPPRGLYRVTLANTEVTPLLMAAGEPPDEEILDNPAYSPDGQSLAYMKWGGPVEGQEIWVAGADGSGPHRLTSGHADDFPVWSPDSRWVAFYRDGARVGLIAREGGEVHTLVTARLGTIAWGP